MAQFERLLITGAGGNLGRLLRTELAGLTNRLRLSSREDLGPLGPNEEAVICDLADAAAVMEMTRDVDMVIHMGGVGLEGTFADILHSNYLGFYNVYEGCRKNGVKRVVWGSSNHAIGFYPRTQRIDSTVPVRPDSNYGVSKVYGEGLAQYYWDKFRVESVSLRIGSCYAKPRDRRMLTTWLSFPDLVHLTERALLASRVEHTIVYGVSNNDCQLWDNRTAAHLGYRPKDNAEIYRAEIEAAHPPYDRDDLTIAAHGGSFAKAGHFED
ncbi:MAG: NAD(P)-dependent oxidoreductase [Pseudomonadota bacterium]